MSNISASKRMWIVIWGVAIIVTLIGGNSELSWKVDIQLPGLYVALLFGWLIGPFGTIMSPLVVGILTIFTNVVAYWLLVVMTRQLWTKFKKAP
jgi:hypothetical protein